LQSIHFISKDGGNLSRRDSFFQVFFNA
jgi:hypothetical protein